MDAGTSHLHHAAFKSGHFTQLEFVLGIESAGQAGLLIQEDACAGHGSAGLGVAHQQMVAVAVVPVLIQAADHRGLTQFRSHLFGEHLIAQPLRGHDVRVIPGHIRPEHVPGQVPLTFVEDRCLHVVCFPAQ
ncbi:hypothetical protein M911_13320 [Ectothiorhodospira haloalkaliphila]|uniref:Uncharacterized protein n=1 Tax=Ectothiorhodospira haloalkaliphila TaxID=421628 RepID=W8KUT5_9GAMM|nr:hypothetical protein M911_13320 [Ectothiorhodospira haloalkaliphila]